MLVLPFKDYLERLNNSSYFIGGAFLVTGAILLLSDRMQNGRKTETMTVLDALKVKRCRPSRPFRCFPFRLTITAGMATGLNRNFAVKFSFLISLPAVLGATLLELIDAISDGVDTALLPAYLLGMAIAGVVGYFSIKIVKLLTQKGKFGSFCYYCFFCCNGVMTIVLTGTPRL